MSLSTANVKKAPLHLNGRIQMLNVKGRTPELFCRFAFGDVDFIKA